RWLPGPKTTTTKSASPVVVAQRRSALVRAMMSRSGRNPCRGEPTCRSASHAQARMLRLPVRQVQRLGVKPEHPRLDPDRPHQTEQDKQYQRAEHSAGALTFTARAQRAGSSTRVCFADRSTAAFV